jgi:hypothetical protein
LKFSGHERLMRNSYAIKNVRRRNDQPGLAEKHQLFFNGTIYLIARPSDASIRFFDANMPTILTWIDVLEL